MTPPAACVLLTMVAAVERYDALTIARRAILRGATGAEACKAMALWEHMRHLDVTVIGDAA